MPAKLRKKDADCEFPLPAGWRSEICNDGKPRYKVNVTTNEFHSGSRCGQIASLADPAAEFEPGDFAHMYQVIDAAQYRGKHFAFSAWVKASQVQGWAGLWARVDGAGAILAFDNMQDRPIKGDSDWQEQQIVLAVPQEAESIYFGLLLCGQGHVYIDDASVAESDLLPTSVPLPRSCGIQYQNLSPTNLDFGEGMGWGYRFPEQCRAPAGWFITGEGNNNYEIAQDKSQSDGICLRSIDIFSADKPGGDVDAFSSAYVLQALHTDYLHAGESGERRVKVLKFSAQIKTFDVQGIGGQGAGLWLRADCGHQLAVENDYMADAQITGTTDWQTYTCCIDVPTNADNIYFGFGLVGSGAMWVHDLTLQFDDAKSLRPSSSRQSRTLEPTNLDFGDGMQGWMISGSKPKPFTVVVKPDQIDKPGAQLEISRKGSSVNGFVTVMQMISAEAYIGSKIKLSADLSALDVDGAAVWLRVDGPQQKTLGFDNMHGRSLRDTCGWQQCACVLDVPPEAESIAFGVMLGDVDANKSTGKRSVYARNLRLHSIDGDSESVTDQMLSPVVYDARPLNMDFEQ